MRALFFRVSWPTNIERYRALRVEARRQGKTLVVKNMSRQRGIPIFLFFLTEKGSDRRQSFSALDEVATVLEAQP